MGAAADLTACVGADLVVRAARLLDGRVVDIAVREGRIETVAEHSNVRPPGDVRVIEADGRLVTPSFVNAHMHLDKVYTLPLVGDRAIGEYTGAGMAGAMTAIEIARVVKTDHYRYEMLLPSIRRALQEAVRYGTLHVQAFVDVDTAAQLEGSLSCPTRTPAHSHSRWTTSSGPACPSPWGRTTSRTPIDPYGRHDMLEVAFLASHLLDLRTGTVQLRLVDMVTTQAARVLGITGHAIQTGAPADLCVHDQERVVDLIREHAAPRWVVARGRVVAETATATTFHLPALARE